MFKSTQIKRYLVSSGITFLTAFLIAVLPLLQTVPTEEALSKSFIFALFGAGLRAGIKALIEYLATLTK